MALAQLYVNNMRAIGREVKIPKSKLSFINMGSTDMGNVSQVTAAIQPVVAIAPKGVLSHSPEFAVASASEGGIDGMCDAAKALAMTVYDLLSNPDNLKKVRDEFNKR